MDEEVVLESLDEVPAEVRLNLPLHLRFMQEAFHMAEKALALGETPVGCVIVHEGAVVASGMNDTNKSLNGTRHAEFLAIMPLGSCGSQIFTLQSSLALCVLLLCDNMEFAPSSLAAEMKDSGEQALFCQSILMQCLIHHILATAASIARRRLTCSGDSIFKRTRRHPGRGPSGSVSSIC
jgi:hypothetical protein